MPTKLIITNETALRVKYGELSTIRSEIQGWIAADQKRGIVSMYAPIDGTAFMRSAGSTPVANAGDRREVKRAIDDLYHFFRPDWAVILGSCDVVPHQQLLNPVKDSDKYAVSDLPYACDVPYSEAIELFRFPTRAVTRLPDVTGKNDPTGVITLLQSAQKLVSRPRSAYEKYFAVSALTFEGSTKDTLQAVFNNSSDLKDVPPETSNWNPALLARNLHFFNCHGFTADPIWWGQQASNPVEPALVATSLANKVTAGSVVATMSCFGAELYNVGATGAGIPICNAYLQNGAAALLGSSNKSYGQGSVGDWGDVLCGYFLVEILKGETVGSAGLKARLRYAQRNFTDKDFKTLAQFLVFGDASGAPVLPGTKAAQDSASDRERTRIPEMRKPLFRQEPEPFQIERLEIIDTPPEFQERIREAAAEQGITESLSFRSFRVIRGGVAQAGSEGNNNPDWFSEIHTGTGQRFVDAQHSLIRGIEMTAVGSRTVWTKEFFGR